MAKRVQFVASGTVQKNMNTAIDPTDLTAKDVTKKNAQHIEKVAHQQPGNTEKIEGKNGKLPNTYKADLYAPADFVG